MKFTRVCSKCGHPASRTERFTSLSLEVAGVKEPTVEVDKCLGARPPCCRTCPRAVAHLLSDARALRGHMRSVPAARAALRAVVLLQAC